MMLLCPFATMRIPHHPCAFLPFLATTDRSLINERSPQPLEDASICRLRSDQQTKRADGILASEETFSILWNFTSIFCRKIRGDMTRTRRNNERSFLPRRSLCANQSHLPASLDTNLYYLADTRRRHINTSHKPMRETLHP
jgi:hypothetical protein